MCTGDPATRPLTPSAGAMWATNTTTTKHGLKRFICRLAIFVNTGNPKLNTSIHGVCTARCFPTHACHIHYRPRLARPHGGARARRGGRLFISTSEHWRPNAQLGLLGTSSSPFACQPAKLVGRNLAENRAFVRFSVIFLDSVRQRAVDKRHLRPNCATNREWGWAGTLHTTRQAGAKGVWQCVVSTLDWRGRAMWLGSCKRFSCDIRAKNASVRLAPVLCRSGRAEAAGGSCRNRAFAKKQLAGMKMAGFIIAFNLYKGHN